jgi:hypothetical protein
MTERKGRGFSLREIEGAGLGSKASKWKLPVDVRRRSVLEKNVQALRTWSAQRTEAPRPLQVKEVPAAPVKAAKEKPKKRPARKKSGHPRSRPRRGRA